MKQLPPESYQAVGESTNETFKLREMRLQTQLIEENTLIDSTPVIHTNLEDEEYRDDVTVGHTREIEKLKPNNLVEKYALTKTNGEAENKIMNLRSLVNDAVEKVKMQMALVKEKEEKRKELKGKAVALVKRSQEEKHKNEEISNVKTKIQKSDMILCQPNEERNSVIQPNGEEEDNSDNVPVAHARKIEKLIAKNLEEKLVLMKMNGEAEKKVISLRALVNDVVDKVKVQMALLEEKDESRKNLKEKAIALVKSIHEEKQKLEEITNVKKVMQKRDMTLCTQPSKESNDSSSVNSNVEDEEYRDDVIVIHSNIKRLLQDVLPCLSPEESTEEIQSSELFYPEFSPMQEQRQPLQLTNLLEESKILNAENSSHKMEEEVRIFAKHVQRAIETSQELLFINGGESGLKKNRGFAQVTSHTDGLHSQQPLAGANLQEMTDHVDTTSVRGNADETLQKEKDSNSQLDEDIKIDFSLNQIRHTHCQRIKSRITFKVIFLLFIIFSSVVTVCIYGNFVFDNKDEELKIIPYCFVPIRNITASLLY